MDWIEEKNKLFEKLYIPILIENGFKKRGWEFYKIIEKDKMAIVVKLTSYSSLPDSASFRIEVGVLVNNDRNKKIKASDIKLFNCKIQFNIIKLIYPSDYYYTGNYSYILGKEYYSEPTKYIGEVINYESKIQGAFTGFEILKSERIGLEYKRQTKIKLDTNRNIIKEDPPYIVKITSNRYDSENIESIYNQLNEDFYKVIEFYKLLSSPTFFNINTDDIIPNQIKTEIKDSIMRHEN